MASSEIIIRHERRPCYVDGKRAMFHTWSQQSDIFAPSPMVGGHPGGTVSRCVGIVEYENGKVEKVMPNEIRFADGGEFSERVFLPEKGE